MEGRYGGPWPCIHFYVTFQAIDNETDPVLDADLSICRVAGSNAGTHSEADTGGAARCSIADCMDGVGSCSCS